MPRKKSNVTESIAQRARKNFELCVKPEHYDRTLRDYRDRLKSKFTNQATFRRQCILVHGENLKR